MSPKRALPAQQPPPETSVLRATLPQVGMSRRLFREHHLRADVQDGGCWWFSSSGEGRFDLTDPHGTCYFGETEGVAVRERCGRLLAMRIPISESLYAGRVVSEVTSPEPAGPVGDLTSPEALAIFGDAGPRPHRGVVRRRDLIEVLQELGYPTVRRDELGSATLDIQDHAEPG